VSFVLDSSVAISWCFKDEETADTRSRLDDARRRAIFVPSLWFIETSNVLGLALRKRRLTTADLRIAVDTLNALEIYADNPPCPKGFAVLLPLMEKLELTAYDATYLELAMRLDLPLATLDKKLIVAATNAEVKVLVGKL